MNLTDAKYSRFALVREMLETPRILAEFDFGRSAEAAEVVAQAGKLLLTGEGSSRIYPAKNAIYQAQRAGVPLALATEGATQALEYNLDDFVVFAASNSGKTKEVIRLFSELAKKGHPRRFGLTAHSPSTLETVSNRCYTLRCGKEDAVAATKSVVEQALFYSSLFAPWRVTAPLKATQAEAAQKAQQVLEAELDQDLVTRIAAAPVVYFAGRNNGVAEELTLKTNEITHKKSDFLEGTYAVHGIEEVMNPNEVVLVVDPFPAEVEKFKSTLVDGVGMTVIALASHDTGLPTIRVPEVAGYDTVLQLLAGWNVLVNVGIALGLDLDKAQRARKIGNEFIAG